MLKIFDKISRHSLPRITTATIICGDCAGDETLPLKTNLTSDGRCADCGGRSYVTAAPLAQALTRHIKEQRQEEELWKTQIISSEKF